MSNSNTEDTPNITLQQDPNAKPQNPFYQNVERTLFTFNTHNMAEICFNQIFKTQQLKKEKQERASQEQLDQVDLCIKRYIQSMKIVNRGILDNLEENMAFHGQEEEES